MAVARSRPMTFSKSFDSFVAPVDSKPVPNHLLDTKIYAKIGQNAVLKTRPSVVHFAGFEVGNKQTKVLRISNASSESQRMHIIPPSTKYFYIKYTKKEKLVPGMFIEVTVEFNPEEWVHYSDCIRIHSKAEENLIVPIHAYPVMSTDSFPKDVHFPVVPVGESKTKIIPLKSNAPIAFEYQLSYTQAHPAFSVEPVSGIVPSNGEVNIHVTFSPCDFSTAIMKLQLIISQFDSSPIVCTFTGKSEPGLAKRLKERQWKEELPTPPLASNVLDPVLIDPLGRTRWRKLKTKPWTPGPPQEVVKNGLRFPSSGVDNPGAVAAILLQQPGKLKAKEIRQAVQSKKDITSTKQMKETMFEYEVHQNIQEERQNQLRWCVRLGEDDMRDARRNHLLDARVLTETEYRLNRGDPVPAQEFSRSSTCCQTRRIHRQAGQVPEHEPRFDLLVNDEWSKRHMVLQRFIQAGRKVIVRLRANRNIASLSDFVMGWRRGKFTREHTRSQLAESEEERIVQSVPLSIEHSAIHPFSFPAYKSPNTKDDMDVDALGTVEVQHTLVKVKTHVPFHNLKVPQQYRVHGYSPHSVAAASSGYVPPKLLRALRVGAEDEIVNLAGGVPLTSVRTPTPPAPEAEAPDELREDIKEEQLPSPSVRSTGPEAPAVESVISEPEAVPLVVPSALFKSNTYDPMHIFNPAPGLQVFKPSLPFSEVDEDYHLCPLPRQRQPSRSGSGKPGRKYLDRQDVIPGVMTWKRFPCQPLVAMAAQPTLSSVWIPRWTDPFSEDLLPREVPSLLEELPQDDVMSDEEQDEQQGLSDIPVPTADMVRAQFPTAESLLVESQAQQVTSQLSELMLNSNTKHATPSSSLLTSPAVSRDQREDQLDGFIRGRQNRLGARIQQRVDSINELTTSPHLELK